MEKFEIFENSKYSKTRNIRNIRKLGIFENTKYSSFSKNIRKFSKIIRKISKNSRNRIFENIRKFTLIRNEYFRIQYSINFEYFRTRNYFVDTLERANLWYSKSVISALLSMEFNVSITLKKN